VLLASFLGLLYYPTQYENAHFFYSCTTIISSFLITVDWWFEGHMVFDRLFWPTAALIGVIICYTVAPAGLGALELFYIYETLLGWTSVKSSFEFFCLADVTAMTIERQWVEIMKNEAPEAFTDEPQTHFESAFIDAQIKLMAMPHEASWDVFLHRQFVQPVHMMLALGARTVVLAFDDYAHVPRAKAITQAKRRANIVPIVFNEGDVFPDEPPMPWDAAMANRAFKASVVAFVTERLPALLQLPRDRSLVVDWRGPTVQRWEEGPDGLTCSLEARKQVPVFSPEKSC